ncbi:MAG: DUF1800 domain-containing protein [Pseudomonadota bacterium]
MTTEYVLGVRFGYGHGPHTVPQSADTMIRSARAPDAIATRYPVVPFREAMKLERMRHAAQLAANKGDETAMARVSDLRKQLRAAPIKSMRAAFARILDAKSPLRERLTWFWADHFTVAGRNIAQRAGSAGYVDEAIRPHVTGRFADMLKAVSQHPAMLAYLDQHVSIGPDSAVGQRRNRGLNENYARELLELHTLGVDGAYTQQDVRAAAELLTGLTLTKSRDFAFRSAIAQPGPETVLGTTYGTDAAAQLSDIEGFLDDLARDPQTIDHLATKLAVHFVSDDPPAELTRDIAATWRDTDGDLAAVTSTLVNHKLAQRHQPDKVKTPITFMASVMLALGLRGADIAALRLRDVSRRFGAPLQTMGQPFLGAPGPDGWSEDPADWITPQGLAARIGWATWAVKTWGQDIADPRAFLARTLPTADGGALRFAVGGAETRADALTLVLASPEFNRS